MNRIPLLLFSLSLFTVSASALEHSGALRWRFDDITVRDPSGARRRSSWFQGYNLDLNGTLLHPAVGSFRAGGGFSQGADINQAVNINSPEQRIIDHKASAQLFSSHIRQYLRFDPNYSLQRMKIFGSHTLPEHTITNTGWGFSSGLSIPKLPAVSVSRQYNAVEDPDGPTPMDQRLNLEREDFSYQLGGVRLGFDHEKRSTEDRRTGLPVRVEDNQRGSIEYNKYDVKKLGLQSLSLRSDYLRFMTGGATTQKSVTGLVSLRSLDLRAGDWTHNLNYWNDSQRDLLAKSAVVAHNLQFNSNRPVKRGSFTNNLSGNQANGRGGTSRGFSAAPGLSLNFIDGRLGTVTNALAGWNRNASGSSYLNDSLEARLTLNPRPTTNLFIEGRTNGTQPLRKGDEGGLRTNRYGLGGGRRFGYGETNIRYDRTEQRQFTQGTKSTNDQVNLLASASPLERLNTTAGFSFSATKTNPGAEYTSRNFRVGLDYYLLWGLQLSADTSYADQSQHISNFAAVYSLGKTQLNLKFQHQQMPAPSSFSYLSISLTRLL